MTWRERLRHRFGRMFDAAARFLFGYDIFISYSRLDAMRYVPELANRIRAQQPPEKFARLSIFVDQWLSPPGEKLPPSLVRAARRASLMVIVVTKHACESSYVRQELESFLSTRRLVIPIVSDDVDLAVSWPEFHRLHAVAEREEESNVREGRPSDKVVTRIARSAEFTTQAIRLQRAVREAVGGIALLLGVAVAVSSVIIRGAKIEAERQTGIADGVAMSARAQRVLAEVPQTEIGWAAQLQESAVLAVAAARKLSSYDQPPETAFASLRRSLDLLPRSRREYTHGSEIESAWLTADGRYLLTKDEDGALRTFDARKHERIAERNLDDPVFDDERTVVAIKGPNHLSVLDVPSLRERWRSDVAGIGLLVFSPDGSRLAAVTARSVIVFDSRTGSRIQSVACAKPPAGVAINPAKNRLALSTTEGDDNVVQIWDIAQIPARLVEKRTLVLRQPGSETVDVGFSDLTFSADGKLLTGSTTFHALVVTTVGLHQFTPIGGPSRDPNQAVGNNVEEIIKVLPSPDGRVVGLIGDDGTVNTVDVVSGEDVWGESFPGGWIGDRRYIAVEDEGGLEIVDVASGKRVARVLIREEKMHADYAPKGERLLLYKDRRVWLYDLANPQQTASITDHGSAVLRDISGKRYAALADATQVLVWDVVNGREVARLQHEGLIADVAIGRQGRYVASITEKDRTIHMWDTARGRELWRVQEAAVMTKNDFDEDEMDVETLAFSPHGNYLFMRTAFGGKYWIFDSTTGHVVMSDTVEEGSGEDTVAFSPDDRFVLLHSRQTVRVLDAGGRVIATLPPDEDFEYHFSPDSQRLAGSQKGDAVVWSTGSWKEAYRVRVGGDESIQSKFTPDGKFLIVVDDIERKHTRIVNAGNGAPIATLAFHGAVEDVHFSADSRYAAIESASGEKHHDLTIVETATGYLGMRIRMEGIIGKVEITPDNRRVVAIPAGGRVAWIFDRATGAVEGTLTIPEEIDDLEISPKSRFIALLADESVRVFELRTRRQLATLPHESNIESMRFVGADRQLATLTGTSARRWILEGEELIARACSQLLQDDAHRSACGGAAR